MSSNPPKPHDATGRLHLDDRTTLVIPALGGGYDPRVAARDTTYYPVPSTYRLIQNPPLWRILLKFEFEGRAPRTLAGLDVYGDVVLGRGSDDAESPDIDLTNLEAEKRGISRRHAMLRPTRHKLYLIDLGSTNGTMVNAIRVTQGMAQTLRSGDTLTLGALSCAVEIIFSPISREGAKVVSTDELKDEPLPPTLKLGKPKTGTDTVIGAKLPPIRSKSPTGDIPPMSSADLEPKKKPDEPGPKDKNR